MRRVLSIYNAAGGSRRHAPKLTNFVNKMSKLGNLVIIFGINHPNIQNSFKQVQTCLVLVEYSCEITIQNGRIFRRQKSNVRG